MNVTGKMFPTGHRPKTVTSSMFAQSPIGSQGKGKQLDGKAKDMDCVPSA